ncbi:probable G-protein coupled receptor B0563.6 [Saccostrea echinata]|uniref:probable G-protein coupled receptor B0563.6 n=1 Tax=Saccostrea echinata TaxID=191078 RepID=UPI002A82CB6D|nr:probable G-protein coupled receptor B0563.6 [Saccostrea echinata]
MHFPNNTVSEFNHTTGRIESNQGYAAEIFGTVCTKYVAPSICVFGIIGNSFSLVVLMRKSLKQSPYINLKALTIVNLLALLVSFPYMIRGENSTEYAWLWYNIYIFIPLVSLLTATSIWIVVLLTVERFLYVKYPLRTRGQCGPKGTVIRILSILFVALLMSLHKFFQYELDPIKNKYIETAFKQSIMSFIIEIALMVIIHFIPLIVLAIINIVLVRTVRQARNRRLMLNLRNNQEGGWQKDERRFTVTLASIVILNICFIGPTTITDILYLSKLGGQSDNLITTIVFMRHISNVLLWFCLSFNFVLYCTFNKRFFQAMKEILQFHRFRRNRFHSVKSSEMTFLRSTNFDS